MKHSKLLKSAVLSTALLWGGATQAQTGTGEASLTIQDAASITVTAGDLSFGSHTGATASQVSLTCATAGDATTGDNKVTDGSCADITLSASAGTISYRVAVLSGVLRNGGTSLTGQPVLTIYESSDGTTSVPLDARSITSGTNVSYVIGGLFDIPENTAAGTYTGNYSVNVLIQ